jgi:hypothetical protein
VFASIPNKCLGEDVQDLFDNNPVVGQIQYMWEKEGKLSGHVQILR